MQKIKQRNRRILEKEKGAIIKHRADRLSVCLAYPATYKVAMANLGFQTVYHLFNQSPDVVCERAFYPEKNDLERHKNRAIPIMSLERSTPLQEFDLIAFSMPFENDLLKMIRMLSLSKIPLLANRRQKPSSRARYPLIMAGGFAVTLNPEPAAPFLDMAAIGEAETIIPELIPRILHARKRSRNRFQWLRSLLDCPGIYIPNLYRIQYKEDGTIASRQALSGAPERISRAKLKDATGHPVRQIIFTPDMEFSDMGLMEISRGCGRACRFCAEGYLLRPPRHRPSRDILDDIEAILVHRDKIGLIAPVPGDYPMLKKILEFITKKRAKVSVSSLRADALPDSLLEELARSDNKTLTLAPETGTERLRKVINKPIPDREFLDAAWRMARAGIKNLKLYFMVGLPTEERMDVEEIPILVRRFLGALTMGSGKKRFPGEISISLNPFVPKPWTPFQWHPQENTKSLKEKISIIRDELKRNPEIRVSGESPRSAEVQGILTRGDQKLAKILIKVLENDGNWTRTIREENFNSDFYLYRPRFQDEILPWDFIQPGVKRQYLMDEYHRALNRKTTKPCRPEKCKICGAC